MRTYQRVVILAVAVISAFVGCQGSPRSSDAAVIQDNQWPVLLARRENQPTSEWHSGSGWVDAVNSGWSHGSLTFRESPSRLAEHAREVLKGKPRLFVPLLASDDPRVVLTAIWIYRNGKWQDQMQREDRQAIAQGFRELLDHDDMRMRWAAVETLAENRMLTVADVAKALADESAEIRATAGMWITSVGETAVPNADESKVLTPEERIGVIREFKRKLVPVLLAHVDDPDFRVRDACSRNALAVVPCNFAIKTPAYCDFVRGAPAECAQAKKAWLTWWELHGEEVVLAAN